MRVFRIRSCVGNRTAGALAPRKRPPTSAVTTAGSAFVLFVPHLPAGAMFATLRPAVLPA
jgi:hypothetical protein